MLERRGTLAGVALAIAVFLCGATAYAQIPEYVRAEDITFSTTYMGVQVDTGVDSIRVHQADGTVVNGANILGPGHFLVDAFRPATNGGDHEAPVADTLTFSINGGPADAAAGDDPDSDGIFSTNGAKETPTPHAIVLTVPAGGATVMAPATFGLGDGDTQQLAVTYDGRDVDETFPNVTFATSDAGVATVDNNGLVTAQTAAIDSATITVTLAGGVMTATATVSTGARMVFATEPAGSTSGVVLDTQPVVHADLGGVDPTYQGSVTLSLAAGAGTLGPPAALVTNAINGVAAFAGVTYTAAVDGENFQLQATDDGSGFAAGTSAVVTSNLPPAPVPLDPNGLIAATPVEGTAENQKNLLEWTAVAEPGVQYQVDLGKQPGCDDVLDGQIVAGTSYQTPRLGDGSYCWRVATDVGGNVIWSPAENFDVIPTFGEWGVIFLIASSNESTPSSRTYSPKILG